MSIEANEKKFKALGIRKQYKLIRLGKKLIKTLCEDCKLKARSKDFDDYCDNCLMVNKKIFDKMNNITGESY